MRRVIYTVILASLLLVPIKRLDVAKLEPVQTVAIYTEPGAVVLKTGEGDWRVEARAGEGPRGRQQASVEPRGVLRRVQVLEQRAGD